MSFLEIGMLICFGISWPISIIKSLKTRKVTGKSPLFMGIVALGYISGTLHKIFFAFDAVIFLYIFNFLMVSTDLVLYYRFRNPQAA